MSNSSRRRPSDKPDAITPKPLVVTYKATGSLKPDPRNARTHSKAQVGQIIASIKEFGFTNPILVDPDGRIIAGHGRLLAALALKMDEVPTIELAGLNDAQKRALRLADNKIALGAGWDLELLKAELTELSTLDFSMDLTVTGFSTGELDVFLGGREHPDDEVVPPAPPQPAHEVRRYLALRRPCRRLRRQSRPRVHASRRGGGRRGRRRLP